MRLRFVNTVVSRALYDILNANVGTADWRDWMVESSDAGRLVLRRHLGGPGTRRAEVVILVDPLGRVRAWSTWETTRTSIEHRRDGLAEALEDRS